MSNPVIHLPLDLTGTALTNKVSAELHIVAATGQRAIATRRGPYFTHGMIVRNKTTAAELVPDVNYRAVHFMIEAGLRTGQEICAVIIILPTTNATEIEIDYQAIGGEYGASVSAIEQMIESLDLDNRTVYWGDLIGAPEYFPPTAHLHDVGDVYGFEYLVAVLEQIRRAILMGDQAAFDELRQYIDGQDNALRALITSGDGAINDHINNTNNPHQTTKTHVGLGLVQNYAVASQLDAQNGTANNLYMTPLRVREAIVSYVGNSIASHIGNTNNPHATTKAHVGLGLVQNFGIATYEEAISGAGTGYMTSTRVGDAILAIAYQPLQSHISNVANPHQVTKTQVGLGSVMDYPPANGTEAAAATATNRYMTPAGVRLAIAAVVGDNATSHFSNLANPHQTTKAQVGLGSVENYPVASGAEATAGTATNRYMTPAGVRLLYNALSAGGSGDLATHVANTSNPHSTTAAQVGLGNVANNPTASQAEAQAGTINTAFMSPLRTAQAISALATTPLTALINQRVVTNSNASLATLVLGTTGYFYQDGDGSISLRVNGNRFFQFNSNGNLLVNNGRVIAAGGFQPSDERLKAKIELAASRPLWRGLEWKSWFHKELQEVQSGFIAQDLLKIAPDRITEYDHQTPDGKVKRFAVDYVGSATEMAYAAGKLVDELKVTVDAQAELIVTLSERLAALEAKQ